MLHKAVGLGEQVVAAVEHHQLRLRVHFTNPFYVEKQ